MESHVFISLVVYIFPLGVSVRMNVCVWPDFILEISTNHPTGVPSR